MTILSGRCDGDRLAEIERPLVQTAADDDAPDGKLAKLADVIDRSDAAADGGGRRVLDHQGAEPE